MESKFFGIKAGVDEKSVLDGNTNPSGTVYKDRHGNWWVAKWGGALLSSPDKESAREFLGPDVRLVEVPFILSKNP